MEGPHQSFLSLEIPIITHRDGAKMCGFGQTGSFPGISAFFTCKQGLCVYSSGTPPNALTQVLASVCDTRSPSHLPANVNLTFVAWHIQAPFQSLPDPSLPFLALNSQDAPGFLHVPASLPALAIWTEPFGVLGLLARTCFFAVVCPASSQPVLTLHGDGWTDCSRPPRLPP